MPIYDYTCGRCGHLAEVIHGMHEAGPRFCPNCGAEGTMRKGFTAAAVHFKGSGWAKKDRSATSSPGRSKPASTPGGAGAGAEGGSGGDAGSGGPGSGNAEHGGPGSGAATATTGPTTATSRDGGD